MDPDDTLAERIHGRRDDFSTFATRLSSGKKLSDIFQAGPPDDCLHIIVQCPPVGECRWLALATVHLLLTFIQPLLISCCSLSPRNVFVSLFFFCSHCYSCVVFPYISRMALIWHRFALSLLPLYSPCLAVLCNQLTRSVASHPKSCLPSLLSLSKAKSFRIICSSKFVHGTALSRCPIGFVMNFEQ